MNLIEFKKIISQPSEINKEQTRGLDHILEEYPYFQSAHFLRLYALKKYRSFKYNDALKKTAAYTTDRTLLFDYITTFDFDIHPAPANILSDKQSISQPTESENIQQGEIENIQPEEVKIVETEFDKDKSKAKEYYRVESDSIKPDEVFQIGEPLDFKSDETYSFGQWLQISQLKPIERGRQKGKVTSFSKPKSNMDLISDFISKSPKITPSFSETYTDAALESSEENEQLMTQTLAHVYVEQKKYDKAIAAFTILSLKYPEKSSLFADRIEAIKKIQNT